MNRYEYLRMQRRCVRCGGQDAKTQSGRCLCSACTEKNGATARAVMKSLYAARKASGLCAKCGKRAPAEGYVLCTPCMIQKERQAANRRESARSNAETGGQSNGI